MPASLGQQIQTKWHHKSLKPHVPGPWNVCATASIHERSLATMPCTTTDWSLTETWRTWLADDATDILDMILYVGVLSKTKNKTNKKSAYVVNKVRHIWKITLVMWQAWSSSSSSLEWPGNLTSMKALSHITNCNRGFRAVSNSSSGKSQRHK